VLRADGRVEPYGAPGTLIGIFDDPKLAEVEAELGPGDLALLYTDGVTDSGPPGSELGEDGLLRVVKSLGGGRSAEDVVAAVEQAAVDSQRGHPRDDIALVAVRVAD
jgi:serine phosphatase RsbU (regulator of sigma subunit)